MGTLTCPGCGGPLVCPNCGEVEMIVAAPDGGGRDWKRLRMLLLMLALIIGACVIAYFMVR